MWTSGKKNNCNLGLRLLSVEEGKVRLYLLRLSVKLLIYVPSSLSFVFACLLWKRIHAHSYSNWSFLSISQTSCPFAYVHACSLCHRVYKYSWNRGYLCLWWRALHLHLTALLDLYCKELLPSWVRLKHQFPTALETLMLLSLKHLSEWTYLSYWMFW